MFGLFNMYNNWNLNSSIANERDKFDKKTELAAQCQSYGTLNQRDIEISENSESNNHHKTSMQKAQPVEDNIQHNSTNQLPQQKIFDEQEQQLEEQQRRYQMEQQRKLEEMFKQQEEQLKEQQKLEQKQQEEQMKLLFKQQHQQLREQQKQNQESQFLIQNPEYDAQLIPDDSTSEHEMQKSGPVPDQSQIMNSSQPKQNCQQISDDQKDMPQQPYESINRDDASDPPHNPFYNPNYHSDMNTHFQS